MRRPFGSGWRSPEDESLDRKDDRIDEIADPDPTVNFPQWSRSLLLLLDYAIIEGLQHRLHRFVNHLKLAEAELTKAASDTAVSDEAESEEETPPHSRAH